MIKSFADRSTESLYRAGRSRKLPSDIERTALRKLRVLDAVTRLQELESPPGNRLEPLRGDRRGQHSIRINERYRICFVWREGDAYEVEITDYH